MGENIYQYNIEYEREVRLIDYCGRKSIDEASEITNSGNGVEVPSERGLLTKT